MRREVSEGRGDRADTWGPQEGEHTGRVIKLRVPFDDHCVGEGDYFPNTTRGYRLRKFSFSFFLFKVT